MIISVDSDFKEDVYLGIHKSGKRNKILVDLFLKPKDALKIVTAMIKKVEEIENNKKK